MAFTGHGYCTYSWLPAFDPYKHLKLLHSFILSASSRATSHSLSFGNVLITYTLDRLCFTASENGHMPAILSMVSVTNCTPIPAVLGLIILAVVFQLYDDVFVLIELTGFAFTVVSALAVCSLLYIRRTNPGLNKSGFKLPIFLHVAYLLISISIGIFSIYDSPSDAALSLGLIGLGIPVYLLGVVWRKPKVIDNVFYKTTVLLQKAFNVVQQESAPEGFEMESNIGDVANKSTNDFRNTVVS